MGEFADCALETLDILDDHYWDNYDPYDPLHPIRVIYYRPKKGIAYMKYHQQLIESRMEWKRRHAVLVVCDAVIAKGLM